MATTTNYSWATPDDTDLVKDGAAAIRTLGSSIDTSMEYLLGGTTGQLLSKASGTDMDFTWATPASAGKVLQVINATTNTSAYTSANTYIDSNLTATITPSSATSKILVCFFQNGVAKNNATANAAMDIKLLRGGTDIQAPVGAYILWTASTLRNNAGSVGTTYLDSPATTSATTYKTQFRSTLNTDGVYVQDNSANSSITLMEIGA